MHSDSEQDSGLTSEIVGERRRSTGPRTEFGKRRSSGNAIKHGLFARVTVLKGESLAEFQLLHSRLCDAQRPVGGLEELLVEKLASEFWRHGRLLGAEGGEIRKKIEALESCQRIAEERKATEIDPAFLGDPGPLIERIEQADVCAYCKELLTELAQGIETNGFNKQRDVSVLDKIYGKREALSEETLVDVYVCWSTTAELSDEERQRKGYATPEQCRQYILIAIRKEIPRLERVGSFKRAAASAAARQAKVELLTSNILDGPVLDRILRAQASIERAIDRTLNRLERLQRMRLGQSVPPPIKVDSSS